VWELMRDWLMQCRGLIRRVAAWTIVSSLFDGMGLLILLPVLQLTPLSSHATHGLWLFHNVQLTLPMALSAYILIVVAFTAIRYRASLITTELNNVIAMSLRERIYASLIHCRWSFIKTFKTGYLNHLLIMNIQNASYACGQVIKLLSTACFAFVYLLISCYFNWMLTAVAAIVGVTLFMLIRQWDRWIVPQAQQQVDSFANLNQWVGEHLRSLKLCKMYQLEKQQKALINTISEQINQPQVVHTRITTLNRSAYLVGGAVAFAVIFYAAVTWLSVPITTLLVLLYIYSRCISQLSSMHGAYQQLLKVKPALDELHTFDQRCQSHQQPHYESQPHTLMVRDAIEVRAVTYRHADQQEAEPAILQEVSFSIPCRQITCFMGPSGCGKSTLLDLLCGLVTPTSGQIYLDGMPLTESLALQWQCVIGYVPQETVLFHTTLRDNLLVGHPDATDDKIWQALHQASASTLVEQLPQGLDTVVGPNGVRLSGGERQRIALARALIKSPQCLVLDEATNALDHNSEQQFWQAIRDLNYPLTIIMVTHQPHLTHYADQVLSLDQLTHQPVSVE